jgi:DNA segregation ATPase FtsK/SpoIIIE-like protein
MSRRVSEFLGVVLFAAALIWLIALVTSDPSDPTWFFNAGAAGPPANFIGRVGAFLAELSFQLLGYAAFLAPVFLGVAGWTLFWCRPIDAIYTKLVGTALLFGCLSALLSLALGNVGLTNGAGGYLGVVLARRLSDSLNRTGSIIVILTLLIASLILTTQFSFGRLFSAIVHAVARTWSRMLGRVRDWADARRREKQRREILKKHTAKNPDEVKAAQAKAAERPQAAPKPPEPQRQAPAPAPATERSWPPAPKTDGARPAPAIAAPATAAKRVDKGAAAPPLPEFEVRTPIEKRRDGFTLPPLTLLDAPKSEQKIDERELMDSARLLEEKCHEFSVAGSVVQIHPGPVVTTFEFKPDAGVKYAKVTGLADDLSLALKAESVLIERIPGKSTVGIQIPNTSREQISLREILESDAYRRSGSKLTLAMGKTIHGEPYLADLAAMPHLLVAGSTGTGKSVAINSMLTSILYRATPEDVRFGTRDVRGDPAPPHARGRRPQAGGERARVGGPRDGRALQDAGSGGRAEHRSVQPEHPPRHRTEAGAAGGGGVSHAPLHCRRDRRTGRPDDGGQQRGRGVDRAARADGARRRHSPDSGHPAAVGRRRDGSHQGEPAGQGLVPADVEGGLPHDPRRQRSRATAGARRHAVPAARLVAVDPAARPLHLRTGERPAGRVPQEAGQACVRRDDHVGGQER